MSGILGLIHLIVWIWAVIQIFKSRASTGAKILWTLIVLVFPLVGLIVWWFMGPKGK